MNGRPTRSWLGALPLLALLLLTGAVLAAPEEEAFRGRLPYSGRVQSRNPAFAVQNIGTGPGLQGISDGNNGVVGGSGEPIASGVYGFNTAGGYGVAGRAGGGFAAVLGDNTGNGNGVYGQAVRSTTSGVYGYNSAGGFGVAGRAAGGNAAVWGDNTDRGPGVLATSRNNTGLFARGGNVGAWITSNNLGLHVDGRNDGIDTSSTASYKSAVYAHHEGGNYGYGVFGATDVGVGVYGISGNGFAGYFEGNVRVNGSLSVQGAKNFVIDHPLDPANMYLYHAAVESPDMKNVYDGIVTTDANGDATVVLPDYVQALNRDFRYQLTVVGQFAQAIVAQEIANNRFAIKTDQPDVKVSWQVTGIRNDPYARAHPMQVEAPKSPADRGHYLAPEQYGKPQSSAIGAREMQRAGSAAAAPGLPVQLPPPGAVHPATPHRSEGTPSE